MNKPAVIRALLVVKDAKQRDLLQRVLRQAGYVIDTAADGEEALARITRATYQVLLADRDLPDMDAATLCRRVRESELPDYLYVLLLAGELSASEVAAELEAGADDYLRQPVDEAELGARLNSGQRIVRLEQSLREASARIEMLVNSDAQVRAFNRRYLGEQLEREAEYARRHQSPLAVVMTDLDHFRSINDKYGHRVGDEVLQGFVDRLRALVRPGADWIARYGGEEFAIVLLQADIAAATAAAERIRAVCAGKPLVTAAGLLTVTASFGVAALDLNAPPADAIESLLRAADAALYKSKHAGRNRVSIAA